jgi:hypothetical protein
MVNQKFLYNLNKSIKKRMKKIINGEPVVRIGGEVIDHYKGLLSTLRVTLVPFAKETYEASEWIYGFIPVRHNLLPKLYFQIPILNVKGKNIPGIANFGALSPYPVKETYVATSARRLTNYLLPWSVVSDGAVERKQAFMNKMQWTPFVEAVNTDKRCVKALQGGGIYNEAGNFRTSVDHSRLEGTFQIMPYKGKTIMLVQDAGYGNIDKPGFHFDKRHSDFALVAAKIQTYREKGEEIGQPMINISNALMVKEMITDSK